MTYHSLVCVHCGTTLGCESRADPLGTPLVAHLAVLHAEFIHVGPPRWADLFEHFRVVPIHNPTMPRVVHI